MKINIGNIKEFSKAYKILLFRKLIHNNTLNKNYFTKSVNEQ